MNFNKFFTYFTIIRLEGDIDKMGLSWCCKKPLLVHICVMVWTLFIVFSFCLSTKSIIFDDHTRPQHQETTKIVNLESLVLGVVKNHNCWFAFCVMVWVIIQCLFNHYFVLCHLVTGLSAATRNYPQIFATCFVLL